MTVGFQRVFYHYTVLLRSEVTKVGHIFQNFKDWWQLFLHSKEFRAFVAEIIKAAKT